MSNLGYADDFKNEMTFAAFSGWQVVETVKNLMGNNKKGQTFNDYLKALGLHEKEKTPQNNKNKVIAAAQKEKALNAAAKIVHLYKKGREKIT